MTCKNIIWSLTTKELGLRVRNLAWNYQEVIYKSKPASLTYNQLGFWLKEYY